MNAPPSPPSRIASRTLQVAVAGVVLAAAPASPLWTAPLYGVAILAVPPLLGRLCRYRLAPLQRAWFSLALAVHPLGVSYGLYGQVLWYDHLAHAASASLVAGLLYLVVAALDDRRRARDGSRRASVRPDRWHGDAVPTGTLGRPTHLAVLAGVLAAGVGWELLELHVASLQVYGPEDTLADVAYDVVGWLVVAPRWRLFLRALPAGLGGRPRRDDPPALPQPSGDR